MMTEFRINIFYLSRAYRLLTLGYSNQKNNIQLDNLYIHPSITYFFQLHTSIHCLGCVGTHLGHLPLARDFLVFNQQSQIYLGLSHLQFFVQIALLIAHSAYSTFALPIARSLIHYLMTFSITSLNIN